MTDHHTSAALSLDGVSHHYGPRKALDHISLAIEPGCVFGILGPNGSGKSTLYRLICTLMPVQEGTLLIYGHDVMRQQHEVRHLIGVTFQSPSLDPQLTVRENLMTHGQLYGMSRSVLKSRIAEFGERFELTDRMGDLGKTLSGGLKRRVEIAKSLLHQPKLLLLDEPSTGLDPIARREFWTQLFSIARLQQMTIVLTTHLMEEAEQCDRVALLNTGQLVASDSPETLKASLKGERILCQAEDLNAVEEFLHQHFQLSAIRSGDSLRCQTTTADQVVRELREQFGPQMRSIAIERPSLEDVFVTLTGRHFVENDAQLNQNA